MLSICIAGDLVPTESNHELFFHRKIKELISEELFDIWMASNHRICNLEVAIIDEGVPIVKAGPNLKCPTNITNGLKALKLDVCNLANNHIGDFGEEGIYSTVNQLNKASINYFGIGKNIYNLKKYHIIEKDNLKVGIYGCAEHEFTIANEDSAGANPYNDYQTNMDLRDLKSMVDVVICLYHGGREHYRYPSPELQKRCRLMVDNGADYVICQHSHCIGCYEDYHNSTIVYGQGNFIFDYNNLECWQTSLLIKFNLSKNKNEIEYIPIVKDKNKIRLANLHEKESIINAFIARSNEILMPDKIEEKYLKEAKSCVDNYLYHFKINHRLGMRNYIECEAHREIVLYAIKHLDLPMINVIEDRKESFIERLFSVKNKYHDNKKQKIIRLFGFKLTFKVKNRRGKNYE